MGAATWPCASSTKSICCTSESPALTRPSSGSTLIAMARSEEHTSELQSQSNLVCRLLLEKKKNNAHYVNYDFAGHVISLAEPLPIFAWQVYTLRHTAVYGIMQNTAPPLPPTALASLSLHR